MTRSRKLLTLLATATTGACAASPPRARAPIAVTTEIRAMEAPPPVVAQVTRTPEVTLAVSPLLQSNGRPACGNVQGKGGGDSKKLAMNIMQRDQLVAELAKVHDQTRKAQLWTQLEVVAYCIKDLQDL